MYGKINLALNVTGVKGGMHLIDTVMASVSLFDLLSVREADDISVECDCAVSGENTALRAAREVRRVCGKSLAVTVKKGIPMGGGLGGSSADAAGVFAAAERLLGLSRMTDLSALALGVGADVPYMLRGGYARARGFGEALEPFDAPCGTRLLVAECGFVPTGECYKISDGMTNPAADIAAVIEGLKAGKLRGLSNALTGGAVMLAPRIKDCMDVFARGGKTGHLTGSGGCVFGEYDEKIKAALIGCGFKVHDVFTVQSGIEFLN